MPFPPRGPPPLPPSFVGLIFLISPVFTISLATASGQLSDRMGPRIPASIGVTMTIAAFVIGSTLRADSPWVLPAVLMALLGLGSGFFNTPNQTAIIGSVPRGQRGFAAGMGDAVFGLGG